MWLHFKMCYSFLGFEFFFLQNQVLFSFQRKYIFQDHLLCILKHKKKKLFAKKETVEIFSDNTFFNLMMIWIATFLNIIFMGILIFSLCVFSVLCVTLWEYKQVHMPMSLHVESRGWLCVPPFVSSALFSHHWTWSSWLKLAWLTR